MSRQGKRQDMSNILARSEHLPNQSQAEIRLQKQQHTTEHHQTPAIITKPHLESSPVPSVQIKPTSSISAPITSTNARGRMDGVWNIPNPNTQSNIKASTPTMPRQRSTTVGSIDSISIKPINGGHSSNAINNIVPPILTLNVNKNINNASPSSSSSANPTAIASSGLGISNDDQRSFNSTFVSTRNNSSLSVQGPSQYNNNNMELSPFFNHDDGSQMSDGNNTVSSGTGTRHFYSGTSSLASMSQNGLTGAAAVGPSAAGPSSIEQTSSYVPESPTFVFSDLVNSFNSNKDEYTLVSKGNDIIGLLQKYPNLQHDLQLSKILPKLCFLMYHKSSEVRAVGFKAVRYLVGNTKDLSLMIVYGKLLIFIIRTLSNSKSSFIERLESVKLIRKIINLPPNGVDFLSIGVVKALIKLIKADTDMEPTMSSTFNTQSPPQEISNDEEIQFVKLNIETICEITLLKPQLSFYSGGFNFLLSCVINSTHYPIELPVVCVEVIMKLLDWKFSRKYLRNGLDLNSLISIFSVCADEEDPVEMANDGKRKRKSMPATGLQSHTQGGTKKKKMTSSAVNQLQRMSALITMILKNFNGVICFTMNDGCILGNLLENLKRRNNKVKDLILDILFDVLLIRSLPWAKSCPLVQWMARYQACSAGLTQPKHEQIQYDRLPKFFLSYSLTNHYVGLLTLVLIRLDIIDMLSQVIEDEKTPIALVEKSTDLLSHILRLGSDLVPPELLEEKLIKHRASNSATIFRLDEFIHKSQAVGTNPLSKSTTQITRANLCDERAKAQQQVNLQGRSNISNEEFKAMIASTRVLEIKKYEDWNLPLLIQLVEGPLRNPKRFDEIIERNPKFLKRILSFYRPFKFRFCSMSINSRYKDSFIELGCSLLETFLQVVPQGVKYLANNKLLAQLSEIMAQIDPYSGITARDPTFSKRKLENNLGYGYLQFIGVLSRHESGIAILESWQFVNILNDLVDYSQLINKNNYFLWNLFMYIDLNNTNSPFRIIFWKLMVGANLKLRLKVMEKLVGPQLLYSSECQSYICEIFVELLMDSNEEIIEKSIDFLDILLNQVVDTDVFLDYFISLKPSVRVLTKWPKGKVLVLKCLGCIKGFRYLKQEGFVDKELQANWSSEALDSLKILHTIERLIQHSFSPLLRGQWTSNTDMSFIKQLLNTEDGLQYFRTKKHQLIDTTIKEILDLFPLAVEQRVTTMSLNFEREHSSGGGSDVSNVMRSDISPTKSINRNISSSTTITSPMETTTTAAGGATITSTSNCIGNEPLEDLYSSTQSLARLKQNLWIIGLVASTKYGIELIDPMGSANIWNQALLNHSPLLSPPLTRSNSATTTPTTASRTSSFTMKFNGYQTNSNNNSNNNNNNNNISNPATSGQGSSSLFNSGFFTPLKSTATARSRASTIVRDINHSSPVAVIIDLFHKCPIWQIKSCCFYVLGMIASTAEGMEMLDEFGWVSVIDNYKIARGYCYPNLKGTIGIFEEEEVNHFDEGIMEDLKFEGYEESNGVFLSDELEQTVVSPSDVPSSIGGANISNVTLTGGGGGGNNTFSSKVTASTNMAVPNSTTMNRTTTGGSSNTPLSTAGTKEVYDHQIFTEVTKAPQLTIASEGQDNHENKEADQFESGESQVATELVTPSSPRPELNEEDLEDKLKKRVISLIVHMNSVLSRIERKCKKELIRLKSLIPDLFENSDLFLEVIKLIDKGNYSFASRNFIFNELFDEAKIYESLLKNARRIRSTTV